jgi:WD domain, G-beta repeat
VDLRLELESRKTTPDRRYGWFSGGDLIDEGIASFTEEAAERTGIDHPLAPEVAELGLSRRARVYVSFHPAALRKARPLVERLGEFLRADRERSWEVADPRAVGIGEERGRAQRGRSLRCRAARLRPHWRAVDTHAGQSDDPAALRHGRTRARGRRVAPHTAAGVYADASAHPRPAGGAPPRSHTHDVACASLSAAGSTGPVQAAAWSPDGTRFLTGSTDNTARIWDATTGQPLHHLTAHTSQVWAVAWSPDTTRVLTGGYDGTARMWDAQSGTLVGFTFTLLPEKELAVFDATSGKLVGASDGAWRWLGWAAVEDGRPTVLPAETFGAFPSFRHAPIT